MQLMQSSTLVAAKLKISNMPPLPRFLVGWAEDPLLSPTKEAKRLCLADPLWAFDDHLLSQKYFLFHSNENTEPTKKKK